MVINWNKDELYNMYYKEKLTMQSIANKFGISKERVRQKLNYFGIHQGTYKYHNRNAPIIKQELSIEEIFKNQTKKNRYSLAKIMKLIPDSLKFCQDCGNYNVKLHLHHLVYPAKNMNDVVILCASCHKCRHCKISKNDRINIYNDRYVIGLSTKETANKYNISHDLVNAICISIRRNSSILIRQKSFL